jgi:predicted esterase
MSRDHPHAGQPLLTWGAPMETAPGAVIALHGRGASAGDILGLARAIALPRLAWLAPQAHGGAWYPYSFLAPIEENQPGLDSALRLIAGIVDAWLRAGGRRERIALLGFSQGACLATEYLARHAARHGALVALTGGLIGPPGTRFAYAGSLAGTPCLLAAGDPDPHVPWQRVEESAQVLGALGGEVTLRRYPGLPHVVNDDEITLARALLTPLAG